MSAKGWNWAWGLYEGALGSYAYGCGALVSIPKSSVACPGCALGYPVYPPGPFQSSAVGVFTLGSEFLLNLLCPCPFPFPFTPPVPFPASGSGFGLPPTPSELDPARTGAPRGPPGPPPLGPVNGVRIYAFQNSLSSLVSASRGVIDPSLGPGPGPAAGVLSKSPSRIGGRASSYIVRWEGGGWACCCLCAAWYPFIISGLAVVGCVLRSNPPGRVLPTDDPEPEPAVPGMEPPTDSPGGEGATSWKNGRDSSVRGSSSDMRPKAEEKDEPAPVPLS